MGTASVQGELWGARAKDWVELNEPAWSTVFEQALAHAGVGAGTRHLDVGCGAGAALAIARGRGAQVAGLDGSDNLVAIARQRLPGARIEVGEMEQLPFEDDTFDVVTGINAFQFAEDTARALAEARRTCRAGGAVFMLAWARGEDCEMISVTMRHVMALLPPPKPGGPAPPAFAEPGTIESLMRAAGLLPAESGDIAGDLAFPHAEIAIRAVMASGAAVRAGRLVGDDKVHATIARTLPAVTRADGSVVWKNRFRWVRAVKPRA
jgi:SAM-dependent methyltransferase